MAHTNLNSAYKRINRIIKRFFSISSPATNELFLKIKNYTDTVLQKTLYRVLDRNFLQNFYHVFWKH